MRKIAMLTDGWKRMVTYAWVDGIIKRIREIGEDICIYQYNCYGNWRKDKKYNQGEYNIFRLPDLNQFDGVVLDCNFMTDKDWLKEITVMLQNVKVPVISIGYAVDGCYYVGIDNTAPIKELMSHLHRVHRCTRFMFAGGPKGNYENYSRMKAFRDYLIENGLWTESQQIWFGDYEFTTGVQYMNRLEKEGQPFPEAIVCANDNIAAGICTRAAELGYQVPGDFIVTGFDNMEKAAYFYPQITTITNDREKIAAATVDMFLDLWSGKKIEMFHFVPTRCVLGESCGCNNNGTVDYRKHIKMQIVAGTREFAEDEQRVIMEDHMADCTDFHGIFHEMAEYVINQDCDGFYAVIDRKLLEGEDEKSFVTQGYPSEGFVVAYASEQQEEKSFSSVKELSTYLEESEKAGSAYMFTPLHFRQYTVGYTIVKNARFLYYNPYFYDIQSMCMRAMEALFKQIQLEKINRRLEEVYNRDPMTGLYNRMAYTEMIGPAYQKYYNEGVSCCLAFFDVNYFKEINDSMGHEFGDTILKRIAETLLELQPEEGYSYRFGGDEFVVFFPYATEERMEEYRERFLANMERHRISVSVGMVLTNPEESLSLDEYLAQADIKMYEMKKAEKKSKKIDFPLR